ncbi:MAG: class I adenylate-forming enzyme family protein [Chloroflexota bacterium]
MIPRDLNNLNDIYAYYVQNNPPEKPVMGFNERAITLAEMKQQVDLFTAHLAQLGVKPGVVVGYTLPTSPEAVYLFLAVSRLGGCAVPLFHMTPDRVKAEAFKRAGAQIAITASPQFAAFKESALQAGAAYRIATVDANPDADYTFATPLPAGLDVNAGVLKQTPLQLPLLVASSSGTTGIPKTVLQTQGSVGAEIHTGIALCLPLETYGKDKHTAMIAFPLSTAGITTCMGILLSGAFMTFSSDVSPVRFMQLVGHWQADSLSAPPAYFEGILSLPMIDSFNLSTVRRVATGMDFFSPSLLQRLKAKFVNLEAYVNGYGLIETTNVFMMCKRLSVAEFDLSTTEMQVFDSAANAIEVRDDGGNLVPVGGEGELYVKGVNVVQGYVNNAEETQKSFRDGWFKTGDIVRNEGENRITLLGRQKYLIKRGGKSVSPVVVQNHINRLPGVKNSAVVGVPHPLYGEMVWAFVVNKAGSDVQLKDVMKHCRAELPNYMVPDQVSFIDDIPKNPGVGKVNYEALKEMAGKELEALK